MTSFKLVKLFRCFFSTVQSLVFVDPKKCPTTEKRVVEFVRELRMKLSRNSKKKSEILLLIGFGMLIIYYCRLWLPLVK